MREQSDWGADALRRCRSRNHSKERRQKRTESQGDCREEKVKDEEGSEPRTAPQPALSSSNGQQERQVSTFCLCLVQVLRLRMASLFLCWLRQDVIFRAGVELGIKVNLHTSRYIWCLVWRTCIQIVQVLQSRGWLRSVHDNMGVDGDGRL